MDPQTMAQQFAEANALFRQGHYEQALDILSALNREHPNTRNIMYAAALCMEKLGSVEEAKLLCHKLIGQFEDQKARELLNHLEVAPRVAGPAGLDPNQGVQVLDKNARLDGLEISGKSRRNLYIVLAAILGAILLLALPFLLQR